MKGLQEKFKSEWGDPQMQIVSKASLGGRSALAQRLPNGDTVLSFADEIVSDQTLHQFWEFVQTVGHGLWHGVQYESDIHGVLLYKARFPSDTASALEFSAEMIGRQFSTHVTGFIPAPFKIVEGGYQLPPICAHGC